MDSCIFNSTFNQNRMNMKNIGLLALILLLSACGSHDASLENDTGFPQR